MDSDMKHVQGKFTESYAIPLRDVALFKLILSTLHKQIHKQTYSRANHREFICKI